MPSKGVSFLLNPRLVLARIAMLRASVNRLEAFKQLKLDKFLAEPDNYAIAEHHLRRALECLFDIGRHIIVKKALSYPQDYRSIIEILGQNKVIPDSFAQDIKEMAGYRNRLVHGYAEVTGTEMYRLIQDRLGDFETFAKHIIHFLEKERQETK